MKNDIEPCKGCICTQCAKSEYNGVMYMCSIKPCGKCENGDYIVKRSYCEEMVPLDEYDTDDLRI